MPVSVSFIKQLESVDPQFRGVFIAMLEEIERQKEESVTVREFSELRDIVRELGIAVRELAEAQKKTEERLNSLTGKVEELTEAQNKTEDRLNSLTQRVEELAKAQRKTEERLDSLARKVEELTEAQKKTEEEIRALVKRMDVFEDRLEGISHSVGYILENRAYIGLPALLHDRYGIKVKEKLIRKYISLGKKLIQINIYGYAKKNGKNLLILGECKVRPSKKEILRFKKYVEKVAQQEGIEIFPIMVAHDFPPSIEEFLQESEIAYFWSYELEG